MPKLTMFRGFFYVCALLGGFSAVLMRNWAELVWVVNALIWAVAAYNAEDRAAALRVAADKAYDLLERIDAMWDEEDRRATQSQADRVLDVIRRHPRAVRHIVEG